jgi:hypothetical protein
MIETCGVGGSLPPSISRGFPGPGSVGWRDRRQLAARAIHAQGGAYDRSGMWWRHTVAVSASDEPWQGAAARRAGEPAAAAEAIAPAGAADRAGSVLTITTKEASHDGD